VEKTAAGNPKTHCHTDSALPIEFFNQIVWRVLSALRMFYKWNRWLETYFRFYEKNGYLVQASAREVTFDF
jgi:hypothetical protein